MNPPALFRFKRQRVLKRFAQFVEYFHLDFLGHGFSQLVLNSLHQLAEKRPLRRVQIFLFVFVEQKQQMNMLPTLQVKIHVPKAATFALPARRIRNPCLANSPKSLDHVASDRIFEKATLNVGQNCIGGILGELVKPPGKHLRFDEYHSEIYTTKWYTCKWALVVRGSSVCRVERSELSAATL